MIEELENGLLIVECHNDGEVAQACNKFLVLFPGTAWSWERDTNYVPPWEGFIYVGRLIGSGVAYLDGWRAHHYSNWFVNSNRPIPNIISFQDFVDGNYPDQDEFTDDSMEELL